MHVHLHAYITHAQEGQFQAGYLNNSKALSRQLVQGSLRYCEGLFADYMEEVVRQNRTQASRGMGGNNGVPSLLNSVRGYLNVTRSQWEWEDMLEQLSRHSQHASAQHPLALTQTSSLQLASAQHTNIAYFEGYPLWPQIFYAFRCGNHRAALELAQLAGEKGGLVSSIFLSCFQQWCQSINDSGSSDLTQGKVIDTNDWTALNQEYNRECRAASGNGVSGVGSGVNTDTLGLDPFKIAMYMIIGRFKVNPAINLLKYIAPTTEDYMWLKLSVVWCFDTPVPDFIATQYTLPKARELSLEYFQEGLIQRGEKHFNADGRSPLRYFKVMLLSLQFEQAIYYLIRTHLFERAVHMMIALDYYGLLRRTLREDQPLLTEAVPSSFASASAASKLAGVGGRGLGFGASAGASQDASVEGGKSYAINLWRIIKKYIQDLTQTNPIECFHYLFLLYIPAHRREVIMKYHYPNAAGGSLSGAGAVGGLSRPLEDNQSMMGLSMASASSSSSSSEIKYMDNEFDQSGLSSSAYNLNSASAGSDGGDSSNIGISEIKCNSLCFKAMSDLILATKEYSLLIGCIRRGRVVKDGCFYHYFPDVIAKLIISNTAHVADENGSFIDAIQLFSLAEKDLQIVLILIAQISRVVSGAINSPTRVEVCNLAKQYLDRKRARGMGARSTSSYSSSSSSSSSRLDSSMLLDSSSASAVNLTSSGSASSASSALASFSGASDAVTQQENEQLQVAEQSLMLLLRLVNYFDLYHLGTPKYNDALVLLDSLQILPWCGDADERGGVIQSDLEMAVARFERLHPSIKRNFPDVVISCMEMYYVKYQQLKDEVSKGGSGAGSMMGGMGGGYGNSRDAARRKLLVDYRVKAKTLINFIGLTALPITADVNFKLVRLEALMS